MGSHRQPPALRVIGGLDEALRHASGELPATEHRVPSFTVMEGPRPDWAGPRFARNHHAALYNSPAERARIASNNRKAHRERRAMRWQAISKWASSILSVATVLYFIAEYAR